MTCVKCIRFAIKMLRCINIFQCSFYVRDTFYLHLQWKNGFAGKYDRHRYIEIDQYMREKKYARIDIFFYITNVE